MKPYHQLFNNSRVEETAKFIAHELRVLLDRNDPQSHMSCRIREDCRTYNDGQTTGERVVATLRALSMIQLETLADLASLTAGPGDDEEEAAAA